MAALNKDLAEQQVKTTAVRDQVGELRRQQAGQEESARRLSDLAKEMEHFETAHKTAQQQVDAFEKLVEAAPAIRQGADTTGHCPGRVRPAGRGRDAALTNWNGSGSAASGVIDLKKTLLESQIQQLTTEIETRLSPKSQGLEQIETSQQQLQAEGPIIEEQERALAMERERLNAMAVQTGQLQSALERAAVEGKELAAKKELLDGANGQESVCPLCQTPLSEDGCQRLVETFEADIVAKREEYRNTSSQVNTLKVETAELESRLPQQEQALTQAQTKRQVGLQQLVQQLQEAQQARLDLAEANPRLEAMRADLTDGSFAAEESVQLKKLEAQIQELEYDPAARQRIFQETQALDEFAQQERLLEQAEAGLPGAREASEQNAAMALRRKEELEALQTQAAEAKEALAGLTALESEFTQSATARTGDGGQDSAGQRASRGASEPGGTPGDYGARVDLRIGPPDCTAGRAVDLPGVSHRLSAAKESRLCSSRRWCHVWRMRPTRCWAG